MYLMNLHEEGGVFGMYEFTDGDARNPLSIMAFCASALEDQKAVVLQGYTHG